MSLRPIRPLLSILIAFAAAASIATFSVSAALGATNTTVSCAPTIAGPYSVGQAIPVVCTVVVPQSGTVLITGNANGAAVSGATVTDSNGTILFQQATSANSGFVIATALPPGATVTVSATLTYSAPGFYQVTVQEQGAGGPASGAANIPVGVNTISYYNSGYPTGIQTPGQPPYSGSACPGGRCGGPQA